MPLRLWSRWKRLAHRAATIESLIVLTVLYWVLVVPIGAVRALGSQKRAAVPAWRNRPAAESTPLEVARRQY